MRRIVSGGLVVAVMACAGCSDEPRPRFEEPTETPSASDPTSSAAADPEPWEEKSKAGAEAFVGLWVSTFSDAVLSGETGELTAISDAGCVTCQNFIARIEGVYANGGLYQSGAWRLLMTDIAPGGNSAQRSITLRVQREAERYRERRSGPLVTYPESKATFTADVHWSQGEWQMKRMRLFT